MPGRSRWSIPLGRVLGFPVDVHASLLIFLAALLLFGGDGFGLAGLLLSGLVFASVLVHELGHSVVARSLGVPILGISLFPFGGVAKMAGMPRGPRDEIAIALAGPVVSLSLAGTFLVLAGLLPGGFSTLAGWLARINGMLGLFNLLPALPMDGGRVLRAWLARRQGFVPATLRAVKVSRVLAWGLVGGGLLAGHFWLGLIGFFVLLAAGREETRARAGVGHYGPRQVRQDGGGGTYTVTRDPLGRVVVTIERGP